MVMSSQEKLTVLLEANTKQFKNQMNGVSRRTQKFKKTLEQSNRIVADFEKKLLGAGLAALFTGMAIKNASQQALMATFKTFQTVTEGTMAYNQSLGRLSAAFEFLKFSIADAFLTSQLGQDLLELLINLFDFISGLSPETQKFLAVILLVGVVLGTILMIAGQIGLAFLGITSLFGPKAVLLFTRLKIITMGILKGFSLVGIVVATVGALIKIWTSEGNVFLKILVTAIILFFALAAIAALLGITISAPFLLVIALIAAIVIGVKVAGAEMKLAFLKAALAINMALIKYVIDPLQAILDMFNRVAKTNFRFGDTTRFAARDLSLDIIKTQQEIGQQRASKAEQEADTKGSAEKGIIFNIENLNANNPEEFISGLKETSLFNKGAGIG